MLDYRLSDDEEALRKTVQEFARRQVAPVIGDYYLREEFPYGIIRQMADMGLFGLPFPEEYGGMGGNYFGLFLAIEELARVDSSVAITLEAAVGLGATPIYRFGSPEQKAEWLPRLCRGEILGAFGLTEPGGGSDLSTIRTTARLDGNEWVLNGSKAFITNAGTDITGLITVAAITGHSNDHAEVSTFIVPAGTPGLAVSKNYSKVGWAASDTREVSLMDCRVPHENLLGEQGESHAQFLATLDGGRIALAALAVGLAQGCLDESVAYAKRRVAFGQPLSEHEAISFTLADMQVRAHAARLAYYRAAELMLRGEPFKSEAAIAKLYASQAAVENARDATQIHGGYGFMNESPVGRMWRDAKVLEIGEGTSEVQRMVIARQLLA